MNENKNSPTVDSNIPLWECEKYEAMGTFPMHKPYFELLSENAFFASMGRNVRFQENSHISTAGVRYDAKFDEFVLEYNSKFMWWISDESNKSKLNPVFGRSAACFVMKHELSHLVLGHVTGRMLKPHAAHQIATDIIINLMSDQQGNTVPPWAWFPGRVPTKLDGSIIEENKITNNMRKILDIVTSWNTTDDHSSEWYFSQLLENASECFEDEEQMIVYASFDEHDWDKIINSSEMGDMTKADIEEYLNEKAREIVEKAVRDADLNDANGWGTIPINLQTQIRHIVSKQVDWKKLLKQFIGKSAKGDRTTSVKRINRKYPYIHPGVKRSHIGKPVVYIDQSGSVGNETVEKFFGELHGLAKLVGIDVYPFDTRVDEKDVIHWRKGGKVPEQREYCGGTDFCAPTRHANDPKNRNRWDGMLILTDGCASKPQSSRIKRAWILAPGCKIDFDVPGETVIHMDNDGKKKFGSWK